MLPADADLAARDPALPGLPVLLDEAAVSALLGVRVTRRYLRYKPGTSCVLGAVADLPDGAADVLVTAYDADGAAKLAKTADAAPAGAVLGQDPARGLLAVRASADRDLPALAALADPRGRRRLLRRLLPELRDRSTVRLTTLSSKPMRRWVGRLEADAQPPVVLRAYRPGDAARAVRALRCLSGGEPRTPRVLAADVELGLLVLDHLPGRPLDALLVEGGVPGSVLADAGRALALLHRRDPAGLDAGPDTGAAVRAAAEQVAVLLPEAAASAARLADELVERLQRLPQDTTVVHGDFSADQVVVDPQGTVALLDLDRAATGDPAADLASLHAALVAAGADDPGGVLAGVLAGYATVRPVPPPQAVSTHAAALLLRRVTDPFRSCAADWPERSLALLAAAEQLAADGLSLRAADPLAVPPDDLLHDLVGTPLLLDVLKDKPGRRRTSRARGPRGTAIVKVYASGRAPVVAARVGALAGGPAEPVVPRVLRCDEPRHVVVLSDVPGQPYREALLRGDVPASARVGRALGAWHEAHRGRVPGALRAHTVDREVATLLDRAADAPHDLGDVVRRAVPHLADPWEAVTVVHRDLYEEQVVLGDRVGLLDLDDAAAGPGELDLGNLLAHLVLLARRSGADLAAARDALLTAYAEVTVLDAALLARCEALSLLRLACLHRDPALLDDADERLLMLDSRAPHAATGG